MALHPEASGREGLPLSARLPCAGRRHWETTRGNRKEAERLLAAECGY